MKGKSCKYYQAKRYDRDNQKKLDRKEIKAQDGPASKKRRMICEI